MQASTAPHSKAPPPERRHSQIEGCVPRFHALQRRYLIWGPFLRLVRRVRPRDHSQLLYHSPEIRALKCVPGCQTLKPGAREKALRREPAPPVAKRGGGASRRSIVQQSAPDCARSTRLEDLGWWRVGRCCQRGRASLSAACSRGRRPPFAASFPGGRVGACPRAGDRHARPCHSHAHCHACLPRVRVRGVRRGAASAPRLAACCTRALSARGGEARARGGRARACTHVRHAWPAVCQGALFTRAP